MALVRAIIKKDFSGAISMLSDPCCDVNEIGEMNQSFSGTPLMAAVSYYLYTHGQSDQQYDELIERLLNHEQCNVNCVVVSVIQWVKYIPQTPFQCAIATGNIKAKRLLQNHPRFNLALQMRRSGLDELHFATFYGDTEVIRILLNHCEINVHTRDINGCLGLHLAVKQTYLPRMRIENEYAFLEEDGEGHVYDHAAIVGTFLESSRYDVNAKASDGSTVLHLATNLDRIQAVRALVNNPRCDVNARDATGFTAFHVAVLKKIFHQELVELFMSNERCDVSALTEGESALTLYMKYQATSLVSITDHLDVVDKLSSSEKCLNAAKHTLAAAIELSTMSVCKMLLQKGVYINGSYPNNETALHCAIRANSFLRVDLLVTHGADLTVTWMDLNPLQYALTLASNPSIICLLSKGVDMKVIESYLEAFSYECESLWSASVRLDIPDWIEHFKDQTQLEPSKYCNDKCDQSSRISTKIKPDLVYSAKDVISPREFHSLTFNCYKPESHRKESAAIVAMVIKLANTFSSRIAVMPGYSHFRFEPSLGGSVVEGTKTFLPDEVDVKCIFIQVDGLDLDFCLKEISAITVNPDSDWIHYCDEQLPEFLNVQKVAQKFYHLCREVCKRMNGREFVPLYLSAHSFITRDKISHLRCMWRGENFKDLIVNIDFAPAFKFQDKILIAKASRHKNDIVETFDIRHLRPRYTTAVHVSDTEQQCLEIQGMPPELRQGLLIAKAARAASICGPAIERFRINEAIDVQDYIKSYHLKAVLTMFREKAGRFGDLFKENYTAYEWVVIIYTVVQQVQVSCGPRVPLFSGDNPRIGSQLFVALCREILKYFLENRAEFSHLSKELQSDRLAITQSKFGQMQGPAGENRKRTEHLTAFLSCI